MDPCWYVTASWGIHDERWVAALRSVGFDPRVISLNRDNCTAGQAREQLIDAAKDGDSASVLAGPLDSVASHLVGIPQRLVGLSWGFDLLGEAPPPDHLDQLDCLIVDSPASAAIAEAAGLPVEQITQIYWGIDVDSFTSAGPTFDLQPVGVPSGARAVLSLRAHEPLYRVGDLIEAWPSVSSQLPEAHLLMGNAGTLTETLKARTAELGVADSIHFLGRMPESELPALLRSVDLYVSTSPVDGTSVTLLQAMACGCPVLVTDAPGNENWITPADTGYLYASGDVHQLADQVVTALHQAGSTEQHSLIDRAQQSVQANANWNRNIHRLRSALLPE